MTGDYRGFAPISSKASIRDTIERAIRRVRETTGDNGPLTITVSADTAAGIVCPLGAILETDPRVPARNVWVTRPEVAE